MYKCRRKVMNKPEDILKFVEAWKSTKGIADNMMLTDDQITEFVVM